LLDKQLITRKIEEEKKKSKKTIGKLKSRSQENF